LFSDGTNLVFQAGARQWPLSDEYRCTAWRTGTERRFAISEKEVTVLMLRYDALDRDEDPTFDDADLEQCDFFVWAARLWNDTKWKQEVIGNLSAAQEDASR
jgi:hypothetical protein